MRPTRRWPRCRRKPWPRSGGDEPGLVLGASENAAITPQEDSGDERGGKRGGAGESPGALPRSQAVGWEGSTPRGGPSLPRSGGDEPQGRDERDGLSECTRPRGDEPGAACRGRCRKARPRRRGDEPSSVRWFAKEITSAPHARGCTLPTEASPGRGPLNHPAKVGMNRRRRARASAAREYPRSSGDEPRSTSAMPDASPATPRARG